MFARAACAVLLLSVVVAPSIIAQRSSDPRLASVMAFEIAAAAAYGRNDAAALDTLLSDDFTLTDSKGVITTKADDLRAARERDIEFTRFENEDMKVRFYGSNTAVVLGRTILTGKAKDGSAVDVIVQFTDTLILINGRWRFVAGHVSRLKPTCS